MMGWSRPEAISALALVVSALGFVLSFLSFWRTWAMDKPNAWAEVMHTSIPNCFVADLNIRNPSRYLHDARRVGSAGTR